MSPTGSNLYLVVITAIAAAIGAIDAAVGSSWDLFVVFLLVETSTLMMVWRIRGRRPAVPIRADLVAWLRQRAAITGEPLTVLADRAIATYRQGTDPTFTHRHATLEERTGA